MKTARDFAPDLLGHVVPLSYADTATGRLLRDMDEAVEKSMHTGLSSPLITAGQRSRAWGVFFGATLSQRMAWSKRVSDYVADVLAGRCQAQTDADESEGQARERVAAVRRGVVQPWLASHSPVSGWACA